MGPVDATQMRDRDGVTACFVASCGGFDSKDDCSFVWLSDSMGHSACWATCQQARCVVGTLSIASENDLRQTLCNNVYAGRVQHIAV
jgi:hypothetical protein